jgi:hypothetical protein
VASKKYQAERFIMSDPDMAVTVSIKACGACSGGLLEQDKFCRWCGAPQTRSLIPAAVCQDRVSSASLSLYTTSALNRAGADARPYRRVSGPLVHALVAGMSRDRSTEPIGRVVRTVVQALVSIPIWLMIVLLSPVDAYVAAKSISREF